MADYFQNFQNPFLKRPQATPLANPTNPLEAAVAPTAPPSLQLPYPNPGISQDKYDEETKRVFTELTNALAGIQDVDWNAKYSDLLKQTEDRPLPKQMSWLSAFAGGLGAPQATANMLSQRDADISNARRNKEQDILSLKSAILQGEIGQLIEKGNFARAMKQTEALQHIHDLTAARGERTQHEANMNQAAMKDYYSAQTSARALNGALSKLRLQKGLTTPFASALAKNIQLLSQQKQVTGEPYYPDPDMLYEAADLLTRRQMATDTPATTGTATPPPGTTGGNEPSERARELSKLFPSGGAQ